MGDSGDLEAASHYRRMHALASFGFLLQLVFAKRGETWGNEDKFGWNQATRGLVELMSVSHEDKIRLPRRRHFALRAPLRMISTRAL